MTRRKNDLNRRDLIQGATIAAAAVGAASKAAAQPALGRPPAPASERVLDDTEVVVRLDQPMPAGVGHVERAMIQFALKKCGGRLEDTAALLGISRKGLYLKRVRYGLEAPGETAPPVAAV